MDYDDLERIKSDDYSSEEIIEEPYEELEDIPTLSTPNGSLRSKKQKTKPQSEDAKNYSEDAKLAAEGLATAYGGKLGGVAVKTFSKTNLGKNTFNKVGNAMDNVIKHPIGIINSMPNNQESSHEELPQESELNNDLSNELDNQQENLKTNFLNNFTNKDSTNGDAKGNLKLFKNKKIRIWIIIGVSVLLLFFLMIFAILLSKDHAMLDLTGSIYKPTSKGNSAGVNAAYAKKNIEKALLYVGDDRVLDMKENLDASTVRFIGSEKANYDWLASTGRSEINNEINSETPVKYVVIALGLYDLDNVDKYTNIFNSLASDESIHYLFMSVNPVDEKKAPSEMTNAKINNFNSKLSVKISDKYIDTTEVVGSDFKSSDGIKYDAKTYKAIHEVVLSYLKANFSGGFLDEYPHGTEGTQLLRTNIITALGQSDYDSLNSSVKTANGTCSKESAAIAGVNLAYGLYQRGYRLPYYWNGGHDMHDIGGVSAYVDYNGVDKQLGSQVAQSCSDTTCYSNYGYDCTGFVNWAVSTSMGRDISTSLDGWFGRSAVISVDEAEPGDIILTSGHAILVIENKGDYLQTLESTGGDNGLIFRTYNGDEVNSIGGTVRSLSPFYDQEC